MNEHLNPAGLLDATDHGFSQVVKSRGGTTIHIAGQASIDTEMNVVGAGDFKTQVGVALENMQLALQGAGASIADLVRMNYYIVDFKQEYYRQLPEVEDDFFGDVRRPAGTLLGVQALALPGLLFEIEATAVIDD